MFRKIISTIFIRTLLAGLNFLLAILTTQYLGPEGKGDVSLFVLNLTIVQLANNFAGGPYLVYLVPRKNIMHLLLPSYAWALLSSVLIPVSLFFFNLSGKENLIHLVIISFMFSVMSINTMIMTGKEKVNKYNITSLIQVAILISAFFLYIDYFGIRNLSSYINALYFSSAIALAASFVFIISYFEKISFPDMLKTFYEVLRSGLMVQAANIAQLFNYRLSFYFLDHFHEDGRKEVGIYSVAVSVAEALWLVSQSVALVLYSRISNLDDIQHSRKLTIALIKIVFIGTVFLTGILLCVPPAVFDFIFGNGFGKVKPVFFPLSAGIITLSVGIILSAYFVGTGKPQVSVFSSTLGLAVTVILGVFMIPRYGMIGAAITASASYIAGVTYQLYKFMREADELNFRDFIFSGNDIRLITFELKNIFITKQAG